MLRRLTFRSSRIFPHLSGNPCANVDAMSLNDGFHPIIEIPTTQAFSTHRKHHHCSILRMIASIGLDVIEIQPYSNLVSLAEESPVTLPST
jgi:hypothetical protein